MYRNFHGSGEVDAEFDDICEGAKSAQYRFTVNSDNKKTPRRKVASKPDFDPEIYYIWGNRVLWGPPYRAHRALLGPF